MRTLENEYSSSFLDDSIYTLRIDTVFVRLGGSGLLVRGSVNAQKGSCGAKGIMTAPQIEPWLTFSNISLQVQKVHFRYSSCSTRPSIISISTQ